MQHVLIIEDELDIAELIKQELTDGAFLCKVHIESDGEEGLRRSLEWRPDIVILDLGLPKLHGLAILRRVVSELPHTKICIISADPSLESRINCLNEGADDYLQKPFSSKELMARVVALARRDKVLRSDTLVVGEVCFFGRDNIVTCRGTTAFLTKTETHLFRYLISRPNQPISRNELLDQVWKGKDRFPNTVDACVEGIRAKLDRKIGVRVIQTVHGTGYRIDTSLPVLKES
jgi:DNA-binding response OmpR family regulator